MKDAPMGGTTENASPLSEDAQSRAVSMGGSMSSQQGLGGMGSNAVPLKQQVSGKIGPLNENEGTSYDLYAGPEGAAGAVSSVVSPQSKHVIG